MSEDKYKDDIDQARKKNLNKAIEELLIESNEEHLSTIILEVNYNPYNMGYKIKKTYTNKI